MNNNLEKNIEIETAIKELQANPCEELLAKVLSIFRKIMNSNGELIIAVNDSFSGNSLSLQTVTTDDGKKWFCAFTSFEEETRGSNQIMSAFTATISQIFDVTLQTPEVYGVIINPWNRTIMLDKNLIQIVIGS